MIWTQLEFQNKIRFWMVVSEVLLPNFDQSDQKTNDTLVYGECEMKSSLKAAEVSGINALFVSSDIY